MSKPKKIRTIIKNAKMGKPWAMYRLGLEYESGKYLRKDAGSYFFESTRQ